MLYLRWIVSIVNEYHDVHSSYDANFFLAKTFHGFDGNVHLTVPEWMRMFTHVRVIISIDHCYSVYFDFHPWLNNIYSGEIRQGTGPVRSSSTTQHAYSPGASCCAAKRQGSLAIRIVWKIPFPWYGKIDVISLQLGSWKSWKTKTFAHALELKHF